MISKCFLTVSRPISLSLSWEQSAGPARGQLTRLHQEDGTSRPQSGVREVRCGTVEEEAGSGQSTCIFFFKSCVILFV